MSTQLTIEVNAALKALINKPHLENARGLEAVLSCAFPKRVFGRINQGFD
jgi:hypothetical protein